MTVLMVKMLFIGTTELLLIGGMALLLFGGKKLPEMMRGLGQGVKEFKKGMNDMKAPEAETPEETGNADEVDIVPIEPEANGNDKHVSTDGESR